MILGRYNNINPSLKTMLVRFANVKFIIKIETMLFHENHSKI